MGIALFETVSGRSCARTKAVKADPRKIRPAFPPAAPRCACSTRCCAAGQPLEAALDRATAGSTAPTIAGSPMRSPPRRCAASPDLDALIDSAHAAPLPDDAKARFALRIALVQALALGTPPHAAISTVLPLVDGGPRKLVHGVFGTLMRAAISAARAADAARSRSRSAGTPPGASEVVEAAERADRRAAAARPDAAPIPPRPPTGRDARRRQPRCPAMSASPLARR